MLKLQFVLLILSSIYTYASLSLSPTKTFSRSTLAFYKLSRETEIQGVRTWKKSPCISIHTSRIEVSPATDISSNSTSSFVSFRISW
ncbi:hypothetical protein L1887_37883 [Cichorium endivia]|nr:hypothetical protein L1887_37883 [Cichorium endivia]